MNFLKTSFFSILSTTVRAIGGFIANKVIAIYTGPAGIALIGQFTNFVNIALTFANGGINSGVIKYTAEYANDEQKTNTLLSNAFKVTLWCSGLIGLCLVLFARPLSFYVFRTRDYGFTFVVFGISITLYAINSLSLAILNGKQAIKSLSYVNMLANLIGLAFTLVLVYFWNLPGALLSIVLSQSVVFFVSGIALIRKSWFHFSLFAGRVDKVMLRKLGNYSIMAIVSALTVPLSQIILREHVMTRLSVNDAGIWQGIMRISDTYLLLASSAISVYFLPKLSSLNDQRELRHEIMKGYKLILPVTVVICTTIYLLRSVIIKVLYTKAFASMDELFLYQMVGDLFKIASWVLCYLMMAKSMIKVYISTEIFFHVLYVLLGLWFVNKFGLIGITYAFALNYFLFQLTLLVIFRKLLFGRR